jgi:hypothetical protein
VTAFDFAALFGAPRADVTHPDAEVLTREGEKEQNPVPLSTWILRI